ncbi:MAG: ribonuclease P protein component [Phycisphaerales bacterium]|nr:ribonuclease P protein component [Phycisphaerales bacterium]
MHPTPEPGSDRPLFRRRHRISRATDYRAAYCTGLRRSGGPLTVFVRPNGLDDHRLGLSVGRRVGPSVVRSRVKRLLRESFRLVRPDLGGCGCDVVVTVRPHQLLPLASYRRLMGELLGRAWRDVANAAPPRDEQGGHAIP